MDEVREFSGLPFSDERMLALLRAYRPILREIEKLRQLELKDVHPAVRFDPLIPYQAGSGER